MRYGFGRTAVPALAFCVAASALTMAQPGSDVPADKPKLVVKFVVALDDQTVTLTEVDGGLARITHQDQHLGISPTVRDQSKGAATFRVYRIGRSDKGEEQLTSISTVNADMESGAVKTSAVPKLSIKLLSIRSVP
jgi:hypothetical protein